MRLGGFLLGGMALLMCGACAPALANHQYDGGYHDDYATGYEPGHGDGYAWARVVYVEPLVRHVRVQTPSRQCYDDVQYHSYRAHDRYDYGRGRGTAGATIVGGLIGGLVGRQFGSGDGRDGATLVGTLVGSAIANDRAQRRNAQRYDYVETRGYPVERCRTSYVSHEEERIDGYRVTYEYDGQEYTTQTHRHPGDRIRVRVAVTPAPEY